MKENGKYKFRGVFIPSQGEGKSYIESRLRYGDKNMKDIMLDFPLSANISELYIGLREGSELLPATPYKYTKPIVFYGSSIVHGCGLRPCSPYSSVISRRFDTDFVNLGFGGGAKAEPALMEYIASLKMSMLVYDYDHNAPTPEYLEETHYAGYKIFREKQPKTPVVFASKPDYHSNMYTLGPVDLKENEQTDSRAREKTGHHSPCRNKPLGTECSQRNRCGAIWNKSEDRRDKMPYDRLVVHYCSKVFLSDKEHKTVDQKGYGKDENRDSQRVMQRRIPNTALAVAVVLVTYCINVDLFPALSHQCKHKVNEKTNQYTHKRLIKHH
jgi:hypothetical protein